MYGGPCTLKKCKIIPHFDLPDLIKLKRIQYPCEMELNEHEIIRAMNYADVFEILDDGTEVLLHLKNFNKNNSGKGTEPEDPDPFHNQVPVKGMEDTYIYQTTGINGMGVGFGKLLR